MAKRVGIQKKESALRSLSWRGWLRQHIWIIISLAVSLTAGHALVTGAHFRTHDDIQVFRLNEYISCWRDGQIPCRWSSEMGKGFGYPYFIFYPPLIYVLPAVIHAVTGVSLIFSLNLSAYLTFPLAAYAMYRLVLTLTGNKWQGAVASIIYTFAPYHALNVFVRGVYAENLALAIMPLLLAWTYEYVKAGKSFPQLALGTAALLMTHNISAMLFIPFITVWGLVHGSSWRNRLSIFMPLTLGVGIAAWFFFPALSEKRLVQTESMVSGYYSYLNHFVSLKQVFLSNYWGYGASGYETESDGMSFAIGYPVWIAAALAGVFAVRRILKNKSINPSVFLLLGGAAAALFMTHAKSMFVWKMIPAAEYIQFPWRFLGFATLSCVAAAGISLSYIPRRIAAVAGILLCVLTIVLYGGRFRPEKYDAYTDQDFISGSLAADQKSAHLYDYLPRRARAVPDGYRTSAVFHADTPVKVILEKRSSVMTRLEIDNPVAQEIVFAQYEYPGWEAYIDQEVVDHIPDPEYGLMRITVPAGLHLIETEWYELPVRKIANYISLLSTAGFLLYNIFYVKKR